MSKFIRKPLQFSSPIQVSFKNQRVEVVGGKAKEPMVFEVPKKIEVRIENQELYISIPDINDASLKALAGTTYARIRNLIQGASEGYQKKLQLVGVGYRAQISADKLQLSLGYSHPIEYLTPKGVQVTCPSQTEIVVQGIDKELVGKVASDIRAFRRPEPYQGKGVRYSDERILRKETKKK